MSLLRNGDRFPKLEVELVDGRSVSLPADVAGSYAVLLIYRGAWCPFCIAQLAQFAAEKPALDGLGVKVLALSTDDQTTGAALVAAHSLGFPIGHGADADAVSLATEAFTNPDPHHLQPAAFILDPDGSILAAVYATHAVGRLAASDVTEFVGYMKARNAAAVEAAA